MARRRGSTAHTRKTIVCRDPATGKSIQFTVEDSTSLQSFAERVHRRITEAWRTTSLTDRRHKRRSLFA